LSYHLFHVDGFPSSTQKSEAQLYVPLSSLRRSSMYGDALAIPWEVWSKDVYFQNDFGGDYEISGGRLIHFTHSREQLGSHFHVSVFDLNRFRAAGIGRTSADARTDCAPFHAIKLDVLPGEIQMERSLHNHLASRSFALHVSPSRPRVLCDDEHNLFWAGCCMFIPRHYTVVLIFLNSRCDVLCGPSWM
jgi:hypothetical protein